jgi:hypothetical protein
VIAFAALALSIVGCSPGGEEEEEAAIAAAVPRRLQADGSIRLSEADRRALDLEVAEARTDALPDVSIRFGRVAARPGEEALVVAPFACRIARPPAVALGQTVAQGTPIALVVAVLGAGDRIEGARLAGEIGTLTREVGTLEARAARARDLGSSNIVSASEREEAETALAGAEARLGALRRARGTGGTGRPLPLEAPVAGSIATLDAPVGAVLEPGRVIARILVGGPRFVDVAVPPADPLGAAYEVEAGGVWHLARLVSKGAVVADDGARHDRLEVAAQDALPGATVAVRVAAGSPPGVVVPESALVPGVDADTVWVETARGRFVQRPVVVATRFGGRARIASGLAAGAAVVVRGAMSLRGESLRADLSSEE